jgi:tetratricopeptide (TPR) repeat protein
LACVHDELGNLERAAMLYSDSAAQISVTEGETLPFAERINNLASVLLRLGLTEPAFFMFGNVSAIRRRELGEHSPLYADSLYNLANAASEAGQRSESLRLHLEALKIRNNEGHVDDIINSLHSIAFLYESSQEYEKAAMYAETAMAFSRGKNENAYAGACNYLAELYDTDRRYKDALPLYDRVLEITKREAGRKHSSYLNVALRRANLLAKLGQHEESLAAHEEVSGIFARETGTNHVFYANCLRGMAMLHRNLDDPLRAEELMLEAIKIKRGFLEDTTLDITFLIRLYIGENNCAKALDALIYAMMCAAADSPDFPELLHTLVAAFPDNPETRATFRHSIDILNNPEKLRPIIAKWEEWEGKKA